VDYSSPAIQRASARAGGRMPRATAVQSFVQDRVGNTEVAIFLPLGIALLINVNLWRPDDAYISSLSGAIWGHDIEGEG
jgi:hypothetical protein